jgi:dTDP-4-dehydrorhamnose reductase
MFLIVGCRGQLGIELFKLLKEEAIGVDVENLDITNEEQVEQFFKEQEGKPNFKAVINCAAFTAVDRAEDEAEQAELVNHIGAKNLAKYGKNIIHISTDYVFDGKTSKPYTEKDKTNPISVYGKTKLNGEIAVLKEAQNALIIRTGWLYSTNGTNFLKNIIRLSAGRKEIGVVFDQVGTPTYAKDLARAIVTILHSEKFNNALNNVTSDNTENAIKEIYHFSNEGVCSWYDFSLSIMKEVKHSCEIVPLHSSEYKTKAVRPSYSILDKAKIKKDFNITIPHWQDALKECIKELLS